MSKISDPLIELLAIKLYEHTALSSKRDWPTPRTCWGDCDEEDREIFRAMARGDTDLD